MKRLDGRAGITNRNLSRSTRLENFSAEYFSPLDNRSSLARTHRKLEKLFLTSFSGLVKRIGVLGGSFDPVHDGHVAVATAALYAHHLDLVILVPTFHNPLKAHKPYHCDQDRIKRLLQSVKKVPQLYVSFIELKQKPPYLTVDTLRCLKENNPKSTIFFILGADSAVSTPRWQRLEEYLEVATFIPVGRGGIDVGRELSLTNSRIPELLRRQLLENFVPLNVSISSTEIRAAENMLQNQYVTR